MGRGRAPAAATAIPDGETPRTPRRLDPYTPRESRQHASKTRANVNVTFADRGLGELGRTRRCLTIQSSKLSRWSHPPHGLPLGEREPRPCHNGGGTVTLRAA